MCRAQLAGSAFGNQTHIAVEGLGPAPAWEAGFLTCHGLVLA